MYKYGTRTIINLGFYIFFILYHVGFSLMIGGDPLKYAVTKQERLLPESG